MLLVDNPPVNVTSHGVVSTEKNDHSAIFQEDGDVCEELAGRDKCVRIE